MSASFGGLPIFGAAVRVVHEPEPVAVRKTGYVGSSYVAAQSAGGRGRRFTVYGVLLGDSPAGVMEAEALLLSYADGVARVLVDTQGRAWPNVLFPGVYRPDREGPKATDGGWCLPYSCELEGLE